MSTLEPVQRHAVELDLSAIDLLDRVKDRLDPLCRRIPPEHRAAYASLGFFPTRTTLNFMGKALAGELETDRRAWRFTLGDTDFF